MSFPVEEFKEILLYIFLAICVMLIPILLGLYVFPFLKSFPGIADITLVELTNYFLQSFLAIVIAFVPLRLNKPKKEEKPPNLES
jgi:hypothetical protein